RPGEAEQILRRGFSCPTLPISILALPRTGSPRRLAASSRAAAGRHRPPDSFSRLPKPTSGASPSPPPLPASPSSPLPLSRLTTPDLPGYRWSDAPPRDAAHAPYNKRAMAAAMIEAMEALGHVRFRLAGHDRGGRVAYRLALDHPGRLERLAVLDIVPTWAMWHRMDARLATRAWHWMFL